MADIESISHSGMVATDTRLVHQFYEEVLCGKFVETASGGYSGSRGGSAHPCSTVADFLFVTFPRPGEVPGPEVLRGGADSYRHGFAVTRERFDEAMEWLENHGVAFAGPVTHPERGPFGESIYFRDGGGNFFEICWRRDEDREYHPVMAGSD